MLTTTSKRIDGRAHVLARFSAPAGVAGVAVLTVEGEAGQGDEVSLYLPKLKRVRKVAKADRGKAFMDTDFAYADIAASGTRDEALERAKDEKVEGRACFVLYGQGRRELSLRAGEDVHRSGRPTCRCRSTTTTSQASPSSGTGRSSSRRTRGGFWPPSRSWRTSRTGSKTQLSVVKLEDATLADEELTERALERG